MANDCARRSAAVQSTADRSLDDFVVLAACICRATSAFLTVVEDDRLSVAAQFGIDAGPAIQRSAVCASVVEQKGPLFLRDLTADARFAKDTLLAPGINTRFFAGLPLITQGDHVVGVLGVVDPTPRELSPADLDALQRLSRQLVSALEMQNTIRVLSAEQEQLHGIAEKISVGLAIIDRHHRYVFANAAYANLLGRPTDAVVGKPLAEVLGDSYEDFIRPKLDLAFAGQPVDYEIDLPGAHGLRHFAAHYHPWNAGDNSSWVFAEISDVTARTLAESEGQRQRNELQLILDAVPALIFYKDREGRFVRVNRELARLTGKSPEVFVGKTDSDLGSPYGEKYHADDMRVINTGQPLYGIEEKLQAPDGDYWLSTDKFPHRDPTGRVVGIIGFALNITKRKLAEDALRNAVRFAQATIDALADHICVLDAAGNILATNKAWRDFAAANDCPEAWAREGVNYLDVCDAVTGNDFVDSRTFAEGIRAVIRGELNEFAWEYPCHSPTDKRWFVGRVTRFSGVGPVRAVVAHENVTERKASEMAAHRLAAIVEYSSDAIIGKDLEGIITSWNKGAEELFGFTASETIGTTIARLIPPQRAGEESRIIARVKNEEPLERFETQRLTKDGRIIEVSITASPIRNSTGRIIGVSKLAHDISERKRREAILKEREQQLDLFVQHSPAAIAMLDNQMRYLAVSRRWMEDYRLGTESIVGRNHYDVFPNMPDRWREIHQQCLAGAVETCDGEPFSRADGKIGWIRWEIRPWLQANETIGGIIIFSEDITERREALNRLRESEERFRELAENIHEVFWMTDPTKKQVLYISPAYESIWGRTCQSLYESPRTWLDAIHPDDRECVCQAAIDKQAAGTYDETYRVRRPDGLIRWIHDQAFPVRDDDGNVVRIVGTAEDITQRRVLAEQFQQAQKMEAIGLLAGGIAHDFNNILAAILGNAEVGRMELPQDHAVRPCLEEIIKAGSRASLLVRQILTFSRQQAQDRSVMNLAAIVQESVGLLRATIPAYVTIEVDAAPDVPPAMVDPTQIHQVLINIGTNAWHAMDDQPGKITISLRSERIDEHADNRPAGLRSGEHVCLSIADTGKGMDAATIERIFDPFFTTKEQGKGTGLGLSVVHGIVQDHDGGIRVKSDPGNGTTFKIYFPAVRSSPGTDLKRAAPAPAPPAGQCGQHILYIDDEEALVYLAKRMLKRLGYEVTGFTRPAEALQAYRDDHAKFDIVISDLNMPGISGLQVVAEILKIRPDAIVALASGHVTEDLKTRARQIGAREVLHKPNSMADFTMAIQRIVKGINHD